MLLQDEADLPPVVGFWRLSMDDPPPRPIGWVLGYSHRKAIEVDFVLGDKKDDLHSYHARLQRNLDTGVLLVISDRHQVFVDGVSLKKDKNDPDQPERDYQLAVGQRTILTLGKLTYLLELNELAPEVDKRQLNEARKSRRGAMTENHADFYLTPSQSADTKKWKHYEIYPPFASGTQGTVSYATNRVSGAVCAIKEIRFKASGLPDVRNEIHMLQSYQHVGTLKLYTRRLSI